MRALPADVVPLTTGTSSRTGAGSLIALAAGSLAAVGVIALARLGGMADVVPPVRVGALMIVGLSVLAAMAAVLAALACRLTGNRRLGWLAVALSLVSVVDVPVAVADLGASPHNPIAVGVRLFTALLLLTMGVWGVLPRRLRSPGRGLALAAAIPLGLLVVGILGLIGPAGRVTAGLRTATVDIVLVLLGAAACVGVALLLAARRRGHRACAVVVAGATTVLVAYAVRLTAEAGRPVGLELSFMVLRLVGVAVILVGLMWLTYGVLRLADEQHSERQEQLRLARHDLDRLAERDHELRNGLAGLAGATSALGGLPPAETERMRAAVSAELARLGSLLCGGADPSRRETWSLVTGLDDVLTLWRAGGMRIDADLGSVPPVSGCPRATAQVVINVLTNCARHAEGSAVRLTARVIEGPKGEGPRAIRRVVLDITDDGPGLGGADPEWLFQREGRSGRSPGQGLGLHICRGLIAEMGGSIEMLEHGPARSGLTVRIELPTAPVAPEVSGSAVPRPTRAGVADRRSAYAVAGAVGG